MSLVFTVVTTSIKSLTRILCKVDDRELINVPAKGPLIIASNHINFMEVPLMYTHLQPREVTGFAKAETWNNPAMAFLFDLWGAIPLQRGQADAKAFRQALQVLQQGKILAVAPEGTRSKHGKLQPGLPGIVMLAFHSKAPILPLVYYGGEHLSDNLKRLRRTEFHIRVGKMFRLSFDGHKIDQELRKEMVDEIMYQLAVLLPEENRGYYADMTKYSTNHLDFV